MRKGEVVNGYKFIKKLGGGAFGQVWEVEKGGKSYAIKTMGLTDVTAEMEETFAQRMRFSCPFLVKYFDSFKDPDFDDLLFVCMEICRGGDLSKLIDQLNKSESVVIAFPRLMKIFIELLLAVRELHMSKVIHRDLKPLNIFVDENFNVKVGDFGCARFISTGGKAQTRVGTLPYMCPEIFQNKPYGESSDLWAVGVIMYQLASSELPFNSDNEFLFAQIVVKEDFKPLSKLLGYPQDFLDTVHSLLNKDPSKRPTIDALLGSNLVREYAAMLEYAPEKTLLMCLPTGSSPTSHPVPISTALIVPAPKPAAAVVKVSSSEPAAAQPVPAPAPAPAPVSFSKFHPVVKPVSVRAPASFSRFRPVARAPPPAPAPAPVPARGPAPPAPVPLPARGPASGYAPAPAPVPAPVPEPTQVPRLTPNQPPAESPRTNTTSSTNQAVSTAINWDDESVSVVIDNGSLFTKAGYAGDHEPRDVFHTVIGTPKQQLWGGGFKGLYVGDDAWERKAVLSLHRPIGQGVVTNWEEMEEIWRYTFNNTLRVKPMEHPVLLTESPLTSKAQREKTTVFLFEELKVPAMYLHSSTVLGLFAYGKTTGIVVDSGETTRVVPVLEGCTVSQAVSSIGIGGESIAKLLVSLLEKRGYTQVESWDVNDIKKKLGYVALDFDAECNKARTTKSIDQAYELADGQMITVGAERFRCTEQLFQPSLFGFKDLCGIHALTNHSIMKCDKNICKELYTNVILTGGTTMFKGLSERIHAELTKIAPKSTEIKVTASHEHTTWLGGSIVASTKSFRDMVILKSEYDELGPGVVHQKCKV